MKGIILAGGTGSRLYPSTKVVNKHLLPVYNKPMVYYPVETLQKSGIREILVVSTSDQMGAFMELLGSGRDFGVDFTYKVQDGSGGIAQALSLAEDFAGGDSVAVVLSDNIFEDTFESEVLRFNEGAQVFVKHVPDPERFGVAEVDDYYQVKSLEEKPSMPRSNLAVTGFYLFDNQVFNMIRQLKPSQRGELEITDVNQMYLDKKKLVVSEIRGLWIDAGTHDSLVEASILAQDAFDPVRIKERDEQRNRSTASVADHVSPKVTLGLLTYNSERYIEPCLKSLVKQDYSNLEIVVLDNCSSDRSAEIIQDLFPEVTVIESAKNLGFGKGHNEIIRQSNGDFYACLNIDMVFEPSFVSSLVDSVSDKPIYGSAGGKLKRWDFNRYKKQGDKVVDDGKTNFLDSVGIRILRSHRFEDIGQGEVDHGQFDEPKDLFGVSGAAVLYRKKALEDVAFVNDDGEKEYFDESMFMYKEDVDLAYRLQWAGWKCHYTPDAIAYHDRTVSALTNRALSIIKNRGNKSKRINGMSYLHHQILLRKNFADDYSFDTRKATFTYNFKVFMYLLLCEQETLFQWVKYLKIRRRINSQRKEMPRRVDLAYMEQLMSS